MRRRTKKDQGEAEKLFYFCPIEKSIINKVRNKGSNSIKIDDEAMNDLKGIIEKSVSRRMQTSSDFIILSGAMWDRIRECVSPKT